MSSSFPLSMAEEGSAVRVVSLRAGQGLDRRLTEIGLNVGCDLIVRQRQGGGMVVVRGPSRFAVGTAMAHRVMVERLEAVVGADAQPACRVDCVQLEKGRESR